jgi:ABC-type branched-subunit amino acid transport system ATPase component/ABC-type branched-subunit amino acid transport system permease subunit
VRLAAARGALPAELGELASPRWVGRALLVIGAAVVITYPLVSDDLFYQNLIILSLLFAIGAVGLNVIMGWGGYISLGQSSFIGLGAYTVGILTTKVGGSPFVWLPAAGLVAALFALVLGAIATRLRGHSFVIATIAALFLLQIVATNWRSFTGGTTGITLPIPEWDIAYQNWPFYYSLLGLLAAALLVSWRIRKTKFGTGLIAIREDEDKAAAAGIDTPVYKALGFAASAVFLGMAGGVYGYYLTFIDPSGMFDIILSVQIVLAVVLGGRGTLWGPVLGAFLIESINELANQQLGGGNSRLLIFGGLLTFSILLLPKGILPSIQELWERRRSKGKEALVGGRLNGVPALADQGRDAGAPVREGERRPAPRTGRPLLEVRGLEKRFGGVHAVEGCSFTVEEGSITALIGPNGSGKTTAFNLIGGMMSADGGEIRLDGRRIDRLSPWRRAYLGLGRTFQITRLFGEMTVLENVVAPVPRFSVRQLNAGAVSGPEAARAEELLEFVGMREFRDQRAAALSFGQQKLVELAQVLMLDPKLIMLDEPAGGINPTLVGRIAEMIRELNRRGKTFLVVEHDMPFVLDLCDPILVLAGGTCICEGNAEMIQEDRRVLDAYLGEDFTLEEPLAGAL